MLLWLVVVVVVGCWGVVCSGSGFFFFEGLTRKKKQPKRTKKQKKTAKQKKRKRKKERSDKKERRVQPKRNDGEKQPPFKKGKLFPLIGNQK